MSTDRDAAREQLAAALVGEGWDAEDALDLAVTLLPVVDRIAAERAAAELRAAADAIEGDGEDVIAVALRRVNSADRLRARADALDPS